MRMPIRNTLQAADLILGQYEEIGLLESDAAGAPPCEGDFDVCLFGPLRETYIGLWRRRPIFGCEALRMMGLSIGVFDIGRGGRCRLPL